MIVSLDDLMVKLFKFEVAPIATWPVLVIRIRSFDEPQVANVKAAEPSV